MSIDNCSSITTESTFDKTMVPIDYILSACSFAALSLSTLVRNPNREVIILSTDREINFTECIRHLHEQDDDRFIVFLPDEPRQVLTTLKCLCLLIQTRKSRASILLISRLHPLWLYRTLHKLVPDRRLLSALRVIRPGKDTLQMFRLLQKKSDIFPLMEQIIQKKTPNQERISVGLTKRELDVILNLLNGSSISLQSANRKVSVKTLYNQKITGLRKMSMQFSSLIELLPSSERKRRKTPAKKSVNHIALEEENFTNAVNRKLFFQVYQPVINNKMNIEGFEVLSRWYQNGRELLPAEFLKQIRTMDSWILLTACVIKSAIEQINKFQGKYWFSINIPACLAGSPALLRMLNSAKKKLSTSEYLNNLVLEFSEDTDWSKDARSVEMLRQLNEQNYQVFLDDCFSEKNVMLPMRHVSFSGYKLDMSVVNSFMDDIHDRSLIEGLAYYCHLIGSKCIAEGVDTYEKFLELKKMGVTAFQGYYFSRPVLSEELDMVLTKSLSKRR